MTFNVRIPYNLDEEIAKSGGFPQLEGKTLNDAEASVKELFMKLKKANKIHVFNVYARKDGKLGRITIMATPPKKHSGIYMNDLKFTLNQKEKVPQDNMKSEEGSSSSA